MIKQEIVEKLVSDVLSEEYFIVQVSVRSGNVIEVIIDGDKGVTIQKCVDVSRHVEQSLDRETEDFELSVLSAGLGNPFRVYRQYLKNIEKEVEVTVPGENRITGVITEVNPEGFVLESKSLVKEEGKKKKVEVVSKHRFNFDSKPEVKNIISFK